MRRGRDRVLAGLLALGVVGCGAGSAPRRPAVEERPGPFDHLRIVRSGPAPAVRARARGVRPMIDARARPVSVFGADLDTAAYALAAARIDGGELPEPALIRVEEFVHAFDYGDPAPPDPAAGPVRVTVEAFPSPARPGHAVLRVALVAPPPSDVLRPPADLVFVVDVAPARRPRARALLGALGGVAVPGDTVAVIDAARPDRFALPPWPAPEAPAAAVRPSSAATGPRDPAAALTLAASGSGDGRRHVVFCSDATQGAGALTVIGIGPPGGPGGAYGDALLEDIARVGGGGYFFAAAGEEGTVAGYLAAAMRPVARDVVVEVRFDPEAVARYRLVGYDGGAADDGGRLAGADLVAGRTVTALYEVAPADLEPGAALGRVRVRYRWPEGGVGGPLEAPLRVSAVARRYEEASGPGRLAHLAAAFAEKLRGSGPDVSWDALRRWHAGLPDPLRERPEVARLGHLIERAGALAGEPPAGRRPSDGGPASGGAGGAP